MSDVREIFAIPTEYKGVHFRSRFEADTAFWLDEKQWPWEYEPRSFLLPSGIHFMPDFYVAKERLWIECRGYETEKGERQLREFPLVMPPDDVFAVFRPGGETVYALTQCFISPERARRIWARVATMLREDGEDALARIPFFDLYCPEDIRPEEV